MDERTPIRVFVSYGHPESEICREILEAIRARETPRYEPWFDESDIRTGDNWRRSIQEGIKNSQQVVACLSPHSTREGGVCLDELAIAVGVQGEYGGKVHSILLGPEKEVKPPATVGQNQWLDMSDWREKKAQGPDAYARWFQAKMQELFRVLESRENVTFNGEIQELRQRLNVYSDTSTQYALLKKPYVGRKWLEEEVEQWLDDPHGKKICLLSGVPAVGKSAFAVHYTHYNWRVAANLFCRSNMNTFNDPSMVLQTLAFQLACHLPDYRKNLLRTLPENKAALEKLTEDELFETLLGPNIANTVDGGQETMAIVVDGLDECGTPERNALARLLAERAPGLPRWLRVLVLARRTPAVLQSMSSAARIELDSRAPQNRADIRAYFVQRLEPRFGQDPQWNASLDALTDRSEGVFLYAEMMSEMLLEKGALEAAEEYPAGLNEAFARWFDYFFRTEEEYKALWRRPIGCLLAAPEPLPKSALRKVMGWSRDQLNDFYRRISVLLRTDKNIFGDETLEIPHAYVRAWLSQEDNPYSASAEDGAEALAESFYAQFKVDVEELSFYEAIHLPELLERAGRKKARREVEENHDWFWRVLDAGDVYRAWGKLDEALELYQRCRGAAEELVQTRGTPEDQRDLSVSYSRIANIYKAQGRLEEALKLYQRGLAISEELAQTRGTLEDQRDLAVSYEKIAGIYEVQGKLEEALKLYQKDLTIAEGLAQTRGTPEDQRDLSVSYNKVAAIYEAQGKLKEALKLYQQGLEIAEELAQTRGAPEDQRDLSLSYGRIAGIYKAQGRLEEALKLYQQSLAIREKLVQIRGTPEDQHDLSASYNRVADIYKAQGKLEEALKRYQQGLAITEELAQTRGTQEDQRDLALSYERIAGIYEAQGKLEKALKLHQKDLAITEELVQTRGTPEDQRDLSVSYGRIADIYKAQGKLEEALKRYQQGLAITEELAQTRGTQEDQRDLALSYGRMANIYKAQGKLEEALKRYQQGLAITEELAQTRGTLEDQRDLSVSYSKMANIYKAQGKLEEALKLYQKDLAIAEGLAQTRGTPEDQRDLSVSYNEVAAIYEAQGKLKKALKLYQQGLAIREKLVQARGTPEDQRDLSVSYNKVAAIYEAQGKLEEALKLYQKGLAIAEGRVQTRGTGQDKDDLMASCWKVASLLPPKTERRRLLAGKGRAIAQELSESPYAPRSKEEYERIIEIFNRLR